MSSTLSDILKLPWIRVPYSCQKSRQYREHNLKFIHHQQFHTVTYRNYSGHHKNHLCIPLRTISLATQPIRRFTVWISFMTQTSWVWHPTHPTQPQPVLPTGPNPWISGEFWGHHCDDPSTSLRLSTCLDSPWELGVFLLEPTKSLEKDNFFLSNWCHWCQLYILPMSTTKNGTSQSSHPQENLFALANSTC